MEVLPLYDYDTMVYCLNVLCLAISTHCLCSVVLCWLLIDFFIKKHPRLGLPDTCKKKTSMQLQMW